MIIFRTALAPLIVLTLVSGCKITKPKQNKAAVVVIGPEAPSTGSGSAPPVVVDPVPVAGWVASPALAGVANIASNFDINAALDNTSIPGSMAPDIVGAFRFTCTAGQVLKDDPIVYPGQPGKSHVHQFFGNTAADANSTYQSLRTTGQSTCLSPLNRSAYWMPAMLDGKGSVVRPHHVTIYYKNYPKSSPRCQGLEGEGEGTCVPLPNGLRFIFGYDMVTQKAKTGSTYFNCAGPTATSGHYADLPTALANCPAGQGNRVGAVIRAPACWDGKNLDSPNHRDHIGYMVRNSTTGTYKCPTTQPFLIPAFTMQVWWEIGAEDDPKLWKFSSDDMRPDLPSGSTFHADWFGAWDNVIMAMWMDNCINKMLSCAAGNLGNGKIMKLAAGQTWTTPAPRLVPVPQ
jgi:hypothetical protein